MAARSIVSEAGSGRVQTLGAVTYRPLYPPLDPLSSLPREEKIALLHRMNKAARAADARVQEVTASLSGVYEQILVAATGGTLAADVRLLVRLSISVQVEQGTVNANAAPAADAALATIFSSKTLTARCEPTAGRGKR